MTHQPADKVLAGEMADYRAKLGQPFDGRWAWYWRNRKAQKHLRHLQRTPPAVVLDYQKAQQTFRTKLREVQREPKRQIRQLRRQLVAASIMAVFQRFGFAILTFLALAIVAGIIWFSLPYLTALFTASPASVVSYGDAFSGPR